MYTALSLPALGIDADLPTTAALAAAHGFDAVELNAREVAELGAERARELVEAAGLRVGGFLLPLEWHEDEETWRRELEQLPRLAGAAVAAGCETAFTWIWPFSDTRDWDDNWAFHVERLTPIVAILDELGCRLALEYVGPATMRAGHRHAFVHRLPEALELATQLGERVGVLIDTYHWHTTGADADELRALPLERIGYVHVNDAPAGLPVDELDDLRRALPGETGVIDVDTFLTIVRDAGYAGPVVAEPFEAAMAGLPSDDDARVAATAAAMRRVLDGVPQG